MDLDGVFRRTSLSEVVVTRGRGTRGRVVRQTVTFHWTRQVVRDVPFFLKGHDPRPDLGRVGGLTATRLIWKVRLPAETVRWMLPLTTSPAGVPFTHRPRDPPFHPEGPPDAPSLVVCSD